MDYLQFASRDEFRYWLTVNCMSSNGVWLYFSKVDGAKTVKAEEALEEALCFGWIDGQIKNNDEKSYIKYFSMRQKNSKWSEKNKSLFEALEKKRVMTDYGRAKRDEAKENGQWDAAKPPAITDEQVSKLTELLKARTCSFPYIEDSPPHENAYANFLAMSPSVKRTYARAYFDAKTEDGRSKRLSWMIERLNKNLKPM